MLALSVAMVPLLVAPLLLDLSGQANVTLRFVSPAVSSAGASGAVGDVREERIDGALAVSLRVDGAGRVVAK